MNLQDLIEEQARLAVMLRSKDEEYQAILNRIKAELDGIAHDIQLMTKIKQAA